MKLKKGEKVLASELGHKDFIYPTNKELTILYDVEGETVPWNCGRQDYLAILVPETAVKISGKSSKVMPVWKKKNMPL